MKKTLFFVALMLALCMYGCGEAVGGKETVPSDTTLSSVPSEVTKPTETTVPEETAATTVATTPSGAVGVTLPPIVTEEIRHIQVEDMVIPYAHLSPTTCIRRPDGEYNGYFRASYVHLYSNASFVHHPYAQGAFWFVVGEEMKSGNRYDVFVPDGEDIRKLDSTDTILEYTLLGRKVQLNLSYALLNGNVLFNYHPHADYSIYDPEIIGHGQSPYERLVQIVLPSENGAARGESYLVKIHFETGQITDILSGFSSESRSMDGYQVAQWRADGSILMAHSSGTMWKLLDVNSKTAVVYDLQSMLPNAQPDASFAVSDGIICRMPAGNDRDRCTLWKLRFSDGSLTKLLEDAALLPQMEDLRNHKLSYVVYNDADLVFHVYDTETETDFVLSNADSIVQCLPNFVAYRGKAGTSYLYDLHEGSVVSWLPEYSWYMGANLSESPDGRKLLRSRVDEKGIVHLLVFLADTNEYVEVLRTNSQAENSRVPSPDCFTEEWSFVYWMGNQVIIPSEDHREFYIYDFGT